MSNDTTTAIKASDKPALRSAVADVLGWVEKQNTSTDTFQTPTGKYWQTPPGRAYENLPDWPIDIAAAWGLVEKMGLEFYEVGVECAMTTDWLPWTCCAAGRNTDGKLFKAYGETAPHAITIAFLRGRGIEVID